ncbi:MAG: sigma factor-like helix-turn-helix DNA-binding protein [Mycobacteriales bacterium]|nr:sigma factor-like helix-turn-helix DNA-binding protein [Mycobacteriales bacterium]
MDEQARGELADFCALAVRRAVAALPLRQRTALVYRYYSDLSVEQTAEAMGRATGTVKSLTSQAIASLRAHADLLDPTDDPEPIPVQERSRG